MKDVHRADPRMGINEGTMRRLAAGPEFSRKQTIQHVWGIIVQFGGVTKGLRQNTMLIVFWTTQVRVDHHCASSGVINLDTVF